MNIKVIPVGPLETNCYVLEKDNEIIIIDPGDDFSKIEQAVKNKKVVACLLTHNHFDHVGALKEVLNKYQLKLNEYNGNNFIYETIKTPGHTADSVTYYFKNDKIMFTGDFIFYHGIGRTDLGGNDYDMQNSLNKFLDYKDDIVIYPGHGPKTILGEEKRRFSLYY